MPRYNKCPNPYCYNNTITGWSFVAAMAGATGGAGGAQPDMLRPYSYFCQNGSATGASGEPTTGTILVYSAPYNGGTAGALTGQTWSVSLQVMSATAQNIVPYLAWQNTSGTQLSAVAGTTLTVAPNAPRIATVVATGPANAARVAAVAGINNAASATYLYVTAVRIEQINDPNMPPADGDSPFWAWDGSTGLSTSTRATDDGSEWWALATALPNI